MGVVRVMKRRRGSWPYVRTHSLAPSCGAYHVTLSQWLHLFRKISVVWLVGQRRVFSTDIKKASVLQMPATDDPRVALSQYRSISNDSVAQAREALGDMGGLRGTASLDQASYVQYQSSDPTIRISLYPCMIVLRQQQVMECGFQRDGVTDRCRADIDPPKISPSRTNFGYGYLWRPVAVGTTKLTNISVITLISTTWLSRTSVGCQSRGNNTNE